ncbi:MAG: hypothetical protein ACM3XM_19040 [Mycobacterium leprae]
MSTASVVIIGSYRKHFPAIATAAQAFRASGMDVLSPGEGRPINPGAAFVFLDSDEIADPKLIADTVLTCIDRADAVYLCNPGGYVGQSATFELGYATARGRRCFAAEIPVDEFLRLYVNQVATPGEVAAMLAT